MKSQRGGWKCRVVVPMRAVPDLVEEIELNADETGIDREYLTFVVNEWDAQALEEALLLKDAGGARGRGHRSRR